MRTRVYTIQLAVAACIALAFVIAHAEVEGKPLSRLELRSQSLTILRDGMRDGSEFVKVHAAEALLRNGYPDGVKKVFVMEAVDAGPRYRIGVWRVLAQAYADDKQNRSKCVNWIVQALKDKDGPDRLHASEALGKLGYCDRATGALGLARGPQSPLQVNALWILANSGKENEETALAAGLRSSNTGIRANTAYALRFLPRLCPTTLASLKLALKNEPDNSDARIYLVSALYVHQTKQEKARMKDDVLRSVVSRGKDDHIEACAALAQAGSDDYLPQLTRLLANPDLDVRIAAANAILGITSRR